MNKSKIGQSFCVMIPLAVTIPAKALLPHFLFGKPFAGDVSKLIETSIVLSEGTFLILIKVEQNLQPFFMIEDSLDDQLIGTIVVSDLFTANQNLLNIPSLFEDDDE